MSASTARLGLFKPGGGSQNKYGPADVVDVDKFNDNFDRIDDAVGVPVVADSSLPTNPYLWQVVHASTTDNLVTWNGSSWVNFLPIRLGAGAMASTYYTQTQLISSGVLDNRYFTQDKLINGGVLDSRYQAKGNYQAAGSYVTIAALSALHIAAAWSNTYTLSSGGGSRTHITANFPAGRFSSPPMVVLSANSTTPDNVDLSYNNRTTTSVDIYMSRSDGSVGSPIATEVSVIALQTN